MLIHNIAVTESSRSREPYRAHVGRFIVDIGNGSDSNKHDYCAIIQESGKFVVLVMHGTSCVAYDGKRFINKDFTIYNILNWIILLPP